MHFKIASFESVDSKKKHNDMRRNEPILGLERLLKWLSLRLDNIESLKMDSESRVLNICSISDDYFICPFTSES